MLSSTPASSPYPPIHQHVSSPSIHIIDPTLLIVIWNSLKRQLVEAGKRSRSLQNYSLWATRFRALKPFWSDLIWSAHVLWGFWRRVRTLNRARMEAHKIMTLTTKQVLIQTIFDLYSPLCISKPASRWSFQNSRLSSPNKVLNHGIVSTYRCNVARELSPWSFNAILLSSV